MRGYPVVYRKRLIGALALIAFVALVSFAWAQAADSTTENPPASNVEAASDPKPEESSATTEAPAAAKAASETPSAPTAATPPVEVKETPVSDGDQESAASEIKDSEPAAAVAPAAPAATEPAKVEQKSNPNQAATTEKPLSQPESGTTAQAKQADADAEQTQATGTDDGDLDSVEEISAEDGDLPDLPPLKPHMELPEFKGDLDEDGPLFEGGEALDETALAKSLARTLARPELQGVKVGLYVMDAEDGQVLICHNGREPMNPASNQKLLTVAAALKLLGPNFRFKTTFYSTAEIDKATGTLKGDLYIKGGGDPALTVEQIYRLATELYARGLRRIEGNIYIDDSYFDSVRQGPGWEQDDTDNAYQAPMGALSANFNAVTVRIRPSVPGQAARVVVIPQTRYIEVRNTATTMAKRRTRLQVHSVLEDERNVITVEGRINERARVRMFNLKIDNPPMFAGWTIHDAMKRLDIRTTGYVHLGRVPEDAKKLNTFYSLPLWRIVSLVNKYSNNHMAEQILKTLGAQLREEPGTWEKGIDVLREFLETEIGYNLKGYRLKNGSGLGDVNQLPPELFALVFRYMRNDPKAGAEFLTSLAVAGRDGTLRTSFIDNEVTDLLRGKTGSLEQVIALSGVLHTRSERDLVFTLFFNECMGKNRRRLKEIQQEIVRLLANYSNSHH